MVPEETVPTCAKTRAARSLAPLYPITRNADIVSRSNPVQRDLRTRGAGRREAGRCCGRSGIGRSGVLQSGVHIGLDLSLGERPVVNPQLIDDAVKVVSPVRRRYLHSRSG